MEISLQIPSGYQFIEKTQTVDSETACRLLHSRFHRRCTNARLDGNQIQILRHVIRCPHCGL